MAAILEVNYFNSYWIKSIQTGPATVTGCQVPFTGDVSNVYDQKVPNMISQKSWPGPANYGDAQKGDTQVPKQIRLANIFVEESRIEGGFNNVQSDLGVRAYINEDEPIGSQKENKIIYSGLFNSSTGVNETNVFSSADSITKAVDPLNGSIQKIFAEDTNLIIFQENKVSRALIDKDAIYSAEGGGSVTSSNLVIGQIVPYTGDYGISKNPESFAVYGFRKYFTDRYRGAVLRLSRDGLTEISNYGMMDYFRDFMPEIIDDYFLNTKEFFPGITTNDQNFVLMYSNTSRYKKNILIGSFVEVMYGYGDPNYTNTYVDLGKVTDIEMITDPASGIVVKKVYFTGTFLINTAQSTRLRFSTWTKGKIVGGWDIYTKQYQLSLQKTANFFDREGQSNTSSYATLAFDETVNGWTSFFTFKPDLMGSLKNKFYSTIGRGLYEHNYQGTQNNRNTFYEQSTQPSVTFVFNPQPDLSKNFLTVNYEGSSGWQLTQFQSDNQEPSIFPYTWNESALAWQPDYSTGPWTDLYDQTAVVMSYLAGRFEDRPYPESETSGTGITALTPPFGYAGFKVKENLYVANLVGRNGSRPGEILESGFNAGQPMSGIKANYVTCTFSTDTITDENGPKELFAVSTTYSKSGF